MIVREPEPTYGTPSTKSYVAQSNVISRAAYRMPVMARRLIFVATALVQAHKDGEMWVEMNVGDVVRALGMDDGSKSYKAVRDSVRTAMQQVFEVEYEDTGWKMHPWITLAEYKPDSDTVRVRFAEEMRPLIVEIQRDFAMLDLADYGKLQGRHTQRLFELLMAESGHEGKDGNPPGQWWLRIEKRRLREMLKIGEEEYGATKDLRRRVVDQPIQEINSAGVGIHVKVEYERKGKTLRAFKFIVKRTREEQERDVNPATDSERDEAVLIAANPEAWDECLEEARKQLPLGSWGVNVEAAAWELFNKRTDLTRPRNRK